MISRISSSPEIIIGTQITHTFSSLACQLPTQYMDAINIIVIKICIVVEVQLINIIYEVETWRHYMHSVSQYMFVIFSALGIHTQTITDD